MRVPLLFARVISRRALSHSGSENSPIGLLKSVVIIIQFAPRALRTLTRDSREEQGIESQGVRCSTIRD